MLTYAIYFDTHTQKGKRAVVVDSCITLAVNQLHRRFGWDITINSKEIINYRPTGPRRIEMVS